MKLPNRCTLLCILTLQSFTAAHGQAMAVPPPPPVKETLAGGWIGPGEEFAYLWLELDRFGHGLLVIQEYWQAPMTYYRITDITIDGYQISFDLQPTESADVTMQIHAKYSSGNLILVRTGYKDGNDWRMETTLRRVRWVLPTINALQEASQRFKTTH